MPRIIQHSLIVVEGPDNSGKTTLAIDLAKRLSGIYINSKRKPESAAEVLAYQDILRQARLFAPTVTDRHPAISEWIYGPAIRQRCVIKAHHLNFCMDQVSSIVYCRPPDPTITLTLADRSQMDGVPENILKLIEDYDEFFVQARWPVYRYDRTLRSVEELCEAIVSDEAHYLGG